MKKICLTCRCCVQIEDGSYACTRGGEDIPLADEHSVCEDWDEDHAMKGYGRDDEEV